MKTRIVLVDSQALFREGVKCLLSRYQDRFEVVGEASTTRELMTVVERTNPDIIVSDIFLPGRSGVEIRGDLPPSRSDVKIAILTSSASDAYVCMAIRKAIDGYFLKSEPSSVLVDGLISIAAGEVVYTPCIQKRMAALSVRACNEQGIQSLSVREMSVLRFFGEGFSTSEIALKLELSTKTIESHRTHIYRKLEIRGAPALMRYAREMGVVCPDNVISRSPPEPAAAPAV